MKAIRSWWSNASIASGILCAGVLIFSPGLSWAQSRQASAAAAGVATATRAKMPDARAEAAFDLSGYWVSLITQDWRFRMIVPGKGEYAAIPINAKAKQFADAWSAASDEVAGKPCEAYGAAVLMRNPERLHIYWQDDNLLQVDTDAGMQTRLLHFRTAPVAAPMASSRQGYSTAKWATEAASRAFGATPARGSRYQWLEVSTGHLLPGLLRKNGVPYGAGTTMREWWELRTEPTAQQWLTISTKVYDQEYLRAPYAYDSIFQREPDGSKWNPTRCSLTS